MRTIKVLSLLFVSCMFMQCCYMMPVTSAAQNHELINISGEATIYPGQSLTRISGIIMHICAVQSATFIGTLNGEVKVKWQIFMNMVTGEMKTVGIGTFDGYMFKDTLYEKSGSFTFITVGNGVGNSFHNEWTIIRGFGGLSHIHGHGTLSGTISETGTYQGTYSGIIFFSQ